MDYCSGFFSQADVDECVGDYHHRFAGRLGVIERQVLERALTGVQSSQERLLLEGAQKRSATAFRRYRYAACDKLYHAGYGGGLHTMRGVEACHIWMDQRRRLLLRQTLGDPPIGVRRPVRGPYQLAEVFTAAAGKADLLAALRGEEADSLKRLESARRRAQRVLDDWDEEEWLWQKAVHRYQELRAPFEAYRAAQCDAYTPKLAPAREGGPPAEAAAIACRTLVNVEAAALIRDTFSLQPLLSDQRKAGMKDVRRDPCRRIPPGQPKTFDACN
jgi:hypothetical protein